MMPYVHTTVRLYAQLRREGYSTADVGLVVRAYELAARLFTGLFRPSGDTFVSHVVGTASILASLRLPAEIVAAGVLHAAYVHGDFGSARSRPSRADRERVRRAVGEHVEAYVARYAALAWTSRSIRALRDRLDSLSALDREVVLMRLSNALDDHLDLGVLYAPDADRRREFIRSCGPVMVEMGERLGFPGLAADLEEAFRATLEDQVPAELRSRAGRERAYRIAPASFRRKLPVAARAALGRGLERLRSQVGKRLRRARTAAGRLRGGPAAGAPGEPNSAGSGAPGPTG